MKRISIWAIALSTVMLLSSSCVVNKSSGKDNRKKTRTEKRDKHRPDRKDKKDKRRADFYHHYNENNAKRT